MMRFFKNTKTECVCKDWIAPMYSAYWKEITVEEYKELHKKYYGYDDKTPFSKFSTKED